MKNTENESKKLHLGCGKNIMEGWINIDMSPGEGVDLVFDLDQCRTVALPFEDNSVDEITGIHFLEHIRDPLSLMQELHRVAKEGAVATFAVPYGASDDAFEDPTHVRQFFLDSFGYFSQPFFWNKDYNYHGDWKITKLQLHIPKEKYSEKQMAGFNAGGDLSGVMREVMEKRNMVNNFYAEMIAVKPIREPKKELQDKPDIFVNFV